MGKKSKAILHIVAGPTASGKSAKAMELACAMNGVIINCDSQQIYDGLPILSAQPSDEDKAAVPHKLYAFLHPNDVCSAGNYRELAQPIIEETLAAGQTPIVCGGTGLYIKALTEGLSPMPDIPEDVRERVVTKYENIGAEKFYAELEARDPEMAARFHVNHKARIIRAMEVLEATGKSLAIWQKEDRLSPPDHWHFEIHKILPERTALYKRCNERFIWMAENGALEEVEEFDARLQSGEVKDGVPLCKALGFKELRAYLNGEINKDEAIEKAQGITRRYAKRQITWFRNQL
ncbi:MAG TPA: tRNA (adenosine(37)-N6)-dimethylallyltransferase MiaA [Alphaproteobacteria bacterium]|nr:tRNA (adenosine(37)-N6)-dimethylallyltransferase MiaA [Alphaproteobacteria bacterium]USO05580.1 MAG: tRNA (adenosine(37)-N6)-dimethylallyltransferase MiaA [Rhodospirillales bacterium]HOO82153.1 tRNA (adenosine(37)-N6)-dimethylallyltransferase MiaA [Alphaproteobacteria bacterium]